jgi:hypothetical protein
MSNVLLVYDGTPEQRAAAQTMWADATFPRGFLEGHQVKLHFKSGLGTAYTARGGSIVMTDTATPDNVGWILLHEIGHLGDFWCLDPAKRVEIINDHLTHLPEWNYIAEEQWAHSFARAYIPPGQSYPYYGIPTEVVEHYMDMCGTGVWAAENGITTGYPDGTYRPDDPVTRGEMAVFLKRAAGV